MSETPRPAPLGSVALPIEDASDRMFLHEMLALGEVTQTGERFSVSFTLGGFLALYVIIGTRSYLVPLGSALEEILSHHVAAAEAAGVEP